MSLVFSTVRCFVLASVMLLLTGYPGEAPASMGPCTPKNGVMIYQFENVQDSITDVDKNKAGTILDKVYSFNLGGTYQNTGCAYNGPAYITATSGLPVLGDNSDGGKWYELNDYLAISMTQYIAGSVGQEVSVPFVSMSNGSSAITDDTLWKTGSKGTVSLMIRKAFVGFSQFNKIVMFTQISTDPNTGNSGPYVSELMMSGEIDVPQSCELDAGKTVEMNFGNIGASAFSQAGAGKKPVGVNAQTHTIGIKCKNMEASALLTLRLEASNVSGSAMVSDNTDIGFIIADQNKNPLIPNDITSTIHFQLDDSATASVPVTAWPVSITGNKPAEGTFTAEGYLRVDFQ